MEAFGWPVREHSEVFSAKKSIRMKQFEKLYITDGEDKASRWCSRFLFFMLLEMGVFGHTYFV